VQEDLSEILKEPIENPAIEDYGCVMPRSGPTTGSRRHIWVSVADSEGVGG